MATKEATLRIPAMHCGNCAKSVTKVLESLPTVEVDLADRESKLVTVGFDESAISLDQIREALEKVGFFAED